MPTDWCGIDVQFGLGSAMDFGRKCSLLRCGAVNVSGDEIHLNTFLIAYDRVIKIICSLGGALRAFRQGVSHSEARDKNY